MASNFNAMTVAQLSDRKAQIEREILSLNRFLAKIDRRITHLTGRGFGQPFTSGDKDATILALSTRPMMSILNVKLRKAMEADGTIDSQPFRTGFASWLTAKGHEAARSLKEPTP